MQGINGIWMSYLILVAWFSLGGIIAVALWRIGTVLGKMLFYVEHPRAAPSSWAMPTGEDLPGPS